MIAAGSTPSIASPRLPQRPLLFVTLLTAFAIAIGEVDRLIAMVPAGVFSVSLNAASSFRLSLSLPSETASPWANLPSLEPIAHPLVWTYFWLDLLLILTYIAALFFASRFIRKLTPGNPRLTLLTRPRWQFAVAAGIADLVENISLVILVMSNSEQPAPHGIMILAAVSTTVKWVCFLLAVLPIFLGIFATKEGRSWLAPRGKALLAHRYSLLVFLPVAGMGLIPASGVLEQLPDVQRTWFDFTQGSGGYIGAQHAGAATITLLIVIYVVFLLGRIVTDLILHRSTTDAVTREVTPLWQWLYGPAVVGVLALLVLISGRSEIRGFSLVAFMLIPLGIIVISWFLRGRPGFTIDNAPHTRRYTEEEARLVWVTGDALAIATAVVASLTLIRSHTVFTVLDHGSLFQAMVPFIGFVLGVAAWPLGQAALEKFSALIRIEVLSKPSEESAASLSMNQGETQGVLRVPGSRQKRNMWRAAWVLILLSTFVIAYVFVRPVDVAVSLGVFGSLMTAISAVAVLIGASVIVHTFYAPPEIFWSKWLRLREAPIASLFTIFVLVTLFAGSNTEVHGVRTFSIPTAGPGIPAVGIADTRHTPKDTIDAWWDRTQNCRVTLPDGTTKARPLIMIAAKGGGIRAAYWTAISLQRLGQTNPCALSSVAVASGVSGGSVGLAISRFNEGDQASSVHQVRATGQSSALAQATLGLLIRDPIYTVTGVPALTGFGPLDGGFNITDIPTNEWTDRAGLMELDWEDRTAQPLQRSFWDPPMQDREDKFSADLILNATDAITGCRYLVSQINAAHTTQTAEQIATTTRGCSNSSAPLPFSVDFFKQFVQIPSAKNDRCNGTLSAATAAMLSARFPYVTPSGVIGPCNSSPQAQIIDGGYTEGTGLGSIIDLSPELLKFAAQKSAENGGDPIMPIIMYLDNDRGGDLQPAPPNAISELMVPITGNAKSATAQISAATLLQRSAQLVNSPSNYDAAAPGEQATSPLLPGSVIVVSQRSEPAIAAPLGWILSTSSATQMDRSLEQEVTRGCTAATNNVNGYPSMGYVVNLFGACPAGVPKQ